ncbi:hypothetical protein GLAREA_00749 [Glarea lozoyensis ATCC 20868]|uniref:Uncharacterized protein n=1 Tax=Glarea lozoyensis (strain ATCC 20868 / MF5171) TaxID=1116229 RepID=S3CXD0_GLAL2|nr:uncharacterized protein GLAREA_00749 [Glarea lozoyensis ATCC 20868]EPE29589.1 hypothetical protein GLAREA_00749 [Glarea lozoyensis ATCC 20868]
MLGYLLEDGTEELRKEAPGLALDGPTDQLPVAGRRNRQGGTTVDSTNKGRPTSEPPAPLFGSACTISAGYLSRLQSVRITVDNATSRNIILVNSKSLAKLYQHIRLLASPTFHRAVRNVHKKVHEARHGKDPAEMGGTNIDSPGGSQIQRFAQNFKEEVKEQFWGAKRK